MASLIERESGVPSLDTKLQHNSTSRVLVQRAVERDEIPYP